MLLIDQVNLLRQNLVQLRNQEFVLPSMGGLEFTHQAYKFRSLLLPARDIVSAIHTADKGGNKLPIHLRRWDLDVTDGIGGNTYKIHLKKLLNMVIHASYLRITRSDVEIHNDRGEKALISHNVFLDSVQKLVLMPKDICLVVCCLAEKEVKNAPQRLADDRLWLWNLLHCLTMTEMWPTIQNNIWKTFFAEQSTVVRQDCQIINGAPFIMGRKFTGTIEIWHIGWRRDGTYSEAWIDVLRLTSRIQEQLIGLKNDPDK